MKTGFLILIGIVLVGTIFFGFLIWRQTVKFEKKALIAKKNKEAYLQQLELEQQRLNEEALAQTQNAEDEPVDNTSEN